MSGEFEKERDLLSAKIRKLRREIEVECQAYLQNTLEDNKGYKYYSSEIEIIPKRRDRDIELLEASFNEKIEALQRQLEVKKQAVIDKAQSLINDYLKKTADIENNHKKPSTMAFKKKEEMLLYIEQQIVEKNAMIDEESNRKLQRMRDEAQRKIQEEQRLLERQRLIDLENDNAQKLAIAKADEERWKKRSEENTMLPVEVVDSELRNFGLKPIPKYPKIEKTPLNGRKISQMSRDELDLVDINTLTGDEQEAMSDRYIYLDFNKLEDKQITNERLLEKKKLRKEAKRNEIISPPPGV